MNAAYLLSQLRNKFGRVALGKYVIIFASLQQRGPCPSTEAPSVLWCFGKFVSKSNPVAVPLQTGCPLDTEDLPSD